MEVVAATTTEEKRRPFGWWFDSRNTCCLACSPWLLSTLSDLNEKTHAMLRMLEEDADTFAQRAEMYYEKRPQLISLVEDFYRAQRSLLEQFDHLRHDHIGARDCHISPLASTYKSCDGCFTKFAPNLKNLVSFPSKDPPKTMDECHEFVYESEVDDFLPEVCYEAEDLREELKNEKLMAEIEKLDEESMTRDRQIMEKGKAIEEMQRKLFEREDEVAKLRQEIERFNEETEKVKAENEVLNKELVNEMKKLAEELGVMSLKNEEQREQLNVKDEEKREVIRQLSLAIEILKDENVAFKKWLASKRWLFNYSEMPQSRVLLR